MNLDQMIAFEEKVWKEKFDDLLWFFENASPQGKAGAPFMRTYFESIAKVPLSALKEVKQKGISNAYLDKCILELGEMRDKEVAEFKSKLESGVEKQIKKGLSFLPKRERKMALQKLEDTTHSEAAINTVMLTVGRRIKERFDTAIGHLKDLKTIS